MQTGRQHLALGHEAALHHIGQHFIGAGASGGKVDMRRIFGGRLEQAREHRRLGKRQILDALAEIEVGRGGDAECAAAHIGAVEIELQDLLLGQVRLEPEREKGLLDLALDGALVGQEQVLGELLGDRGPALDHRIGADILLHRPDQAEEIDAEMLEEAPVLRRQHRLDDLVRHLVDRDGIALDDPALPDLVAVAVEKGDGEIILCAPVSGCLLEGGQCQRQHDDRACGAHGETFAEQLDRAPAPAGDAETPEEDRQRFPNLAGSEPRFIERGIDPGVDSQQPAGRRALGFAGWTRLFHCTATILGSNSTKPAHQISERKQT